MTYRNVAIIAKIHDPRCHEVAGDLVKWLAARQLHALYDQHLARHAGLDAPSTEEEIRDQADLAVVLGGDGTLIGSARFFNGRSIPVVGVNLGSLGFLTEITVEEMLETLESCLQGQMQLSQRTMLDVEVFRGEERIFACCCLNDMVINKGSISRIIDIETRVGNQYLTNYKADGLIISTPTGSTGYCLSAGGPIIYPTLDCITLIPICPHVLTNRPLVLPADQEIRLSVASSYEETVFLTCDGQKGVTMQEKDEVVVRRSKRAVELVMSGHKDYFEILRTKLKWNER